MVMAKGEGNLPRVKNPAPGITIVPGALCSVISLLPLGQKRGTNVHG